jgi:hypothetical protein
LLLVQHNLHGLCTHEYLILEDRSGSVCAAWALQTGSRNILDFARGRRQL